MKTNPKNIKLKNLYWLSGILEGEGCFCYYLSPGIRVGSTDEDIVHRIAKYFQKKVHGPYKYKTNKKSFYYVDIWGIEAINWMKRLYPLMGIRRKEKIKEIINKFKIAPTKGHLKGTGAIPNCHPRRKNYAFKLCRSCYRKMKWKKGEPR